MAWIITIAACLFLVVAAFALYAMEQPAKSRAAGASVAPELSESPRVRAQLMNPIAAFLDDEQETPRPQPPTEESLCATPAANVNTTSTLTRGQGNVIGGVLLVQLLLTAWPLITKRELKPEPQWEYKLVAPSDVQFESTMQQVGSTGWEIVSARRATSSQGDDAMYEMILKRPKR